MKVAVLMGGRSPEREVSLRSGKNAANALEKAGFEVVLIDAGENTVEKLKDSRAQVAFLALHGELGEDGTLQGLLEFIGIPYTGSGVLASALAMNKIISKKIFAANRIPTPDWLDFKKWHTSVEQILQKIKQNGFTCPLVIKPANLGSTIGVTKVTGEEQIPEALNQAFRFAEEILIEPFIAGRELTVGILGGEEAFALSVMEIIPKGEYYTYETKYLPGMSDHILPAPIPPKLYKKAQELAVQSHNALGCYGMSRVDLVMSQEGRLFVLEVNTIPGMTETSLLPEAAAYQGINFCALVKKQVEWAIERDNRKKAVSRTGPGLLKD